ncbi:hypothetical protein [Rhodococcus koreensis]|uniref:hypothetical protein n=1 Tax=Rhodococcus koreensis TaxID=99653 RepID=UPI00366C7C22
MGGFQFFGSCDTVAEQMRALHEVGVDSLVVGFLDPLEGLEGLEGLEMEDHILPRSLQFAVRSFVIVPSRLHLNLSYVELLDK